MDTLSIYTLKNHAAMLMLAVNIQTQEVGILLTRAIERAIDFGHVSASGLVSWSRLYALTERDDVSGDLHAFALRDAKQILSVWDENEDN